MVGAVGSNVNSIQFYRATQAFKTASAQGANKVEENNSPIQSSAEEALKTSSEKLNSPIMPKHRAYADEVKNYAMSRGNDLSDNDIDYALRYGRSILVDTSV